MDATAELTKLDSSNLYATGHDDSGLTVQFHARGCAAGKKGQGCGCDGGDVFHYAGVPADEHKKLRSVVSPGAYFHTYIRNAVTQGRPRYPASKR